MMSSLVIFPLAGLLTSGLSVSDTFPLSNGNAQLFPIRPIEVQAASINAVFWCVKNGTGINKLLINSRSSSERNSFCKIFL